MASIARKRKFFDPKFFADESQGEGEEKKKKEGDLSFDLPTPDSSPSRATPLDDQSGPDDFVGKKCGAKKIVITKPKMNTVKPLID